MKEVSEQLKPGTAALFAQVTSGSADAIEAAFRQFSGRVIQTSLPPEFEDGLREALRTQRLSRAASPRGRARAGPRPCYDRAAMPDRFYITTAIAYANNKPGLHTLYEVIGADALARWHRMRGIPTRFLTGTDEHSVNIAMRAAEEGATPRDFVDEKVALFQAAEDALLISPDRFIRTTDPDHVRSAQEMVRRAHANGDIYVGTYEGWYCPNEGFRNADRRARDGGRARSARTTPTSRSSG